VQALKLAETMREVQHLADQGYEILQTDESTFNANAYIDKAWSHKKNPLQRIRRYVPVRGVAVIGVISPVRGLVHCHYEARSCNADSVMEVLKAVRKVYDKGEKIAIFLDNARIHRAKKVQAFARTPAIDIPLAYNQPYRCDLVGIEQYWRLVKVQYRRRLVFYKVNGIDFDHEGLVQDACEAVPNAQVIRCAQEGFKKLMEAEPIKPLAIEPPPQGYPVVNLRRAVQVGGGSGAEDESEGSEPSDRTEETE